MKMKHGKIFLLFFVIFSILLLFPQGTSLAQVGTSVANPVTALEMGRALQESIIDPVVEAGANFIVSILSKIASLLFWLGAQIIGSLLDLNSQILDFPVVQAGWEIVRDLANLGFVFAIILISVATIVRYKDYGAKRLLPRLIAAAILVNFSLTIGGVFIDFSNVLTDFFISKTSTEGVFGLSTSLADAFNPQALYEVRGELITQSTKLGITFIRILSVFAISFFTLISAISLLAIAVMLLIRLVFLSILLVVSPITWLFWTVPQLSSEFTKWWKNFISWVFYAPILSFFLYLTVYSVEKIREFNQAYEIKQLTATGVDALSTDAVLIPDFFGIVMNMMIVIGFLVGGLLTAQSLGIAGAKHVTSLATQAGRGTKKWAGKKVGYRTRDIGRRTLAGGVDQEGKTRFERFSETKTGKLISRIPLVGAAVTGISSASSSAKEKLRKDSEEQQKKYDSETRQNLVMRLNRALPTMPISQFSAIANAAMKKGGWEDIEKDPALKERVINAAKKTGNKDAVLGVAPSLAPRFEKRREDESQGKFESRVIEKAMSKVTDATKLIKDVLKDSNVATNVRPSHITQLGNLGTSEQKETIKETLATTIGNQDLTNLNNMKQELINMEKQISDAIDSKASKEELTPLVNKRSELNQNINSFKTGLSEQKKKAVRVYEAIQENTNWHDTIPPLKPTVTQRSRIIMP